MSELHVRGFRAGAVAAGIKYMERLDLGMIWSDTPAHAAAMFTRNDVKAAPVIDGMNKLLHNRENMRGIVVNSGNANACTGPVGIRDVTEVAGLAAEKAGCRPEDLFVASTGVIGLPLPMERFRQAVPGLADTLSENGFNDVADAILTTDTVRKTAFRKFQAGGVEVRMAGMAKGAGMIGPDMGVPSATMLAFIITDAPVGADWWQDALVRAVDASFNSIIVDGDTSTNDTVIALANGMATGRPDTQAATDPDMKKKVCQALSDISMELARQIVMDGEGATKCVDVTVSGAVSKEDADRAARTIACSPLVKTAFFGNDPNWGRILAAAGRAGINMNPEGADLYIGDVMVASDGKGAGGDAEKRAAAIMRGREFAIRLDLNMGDESATVITTDLSDEYVHINADYRT
jgi:glutamate N-acetyltransferase/amino-acid N-acetyltransferase